MHRHRSHRKSTGRRPRLPIKEACRALDIPQDSFAQLGRSISPGTTERRPSSTTPTKAAPTNSSFASPEPTKIYSPGSSRPPTIRSNEGVRSERAVAQIRIDIVPVPGTRLLSGMPMVLLAQIPIYLYALQLLLRY